MEDGVKEDPAKPKEVKSMGKAGWLKKSSGKFLGSYKDRYVQLERTEIAVYDNEDKNNCVERIDLENFEKCHELRSPFKKKYRLILIRAPKSGSKVYDVKLQAQNQEEKDAWIKALSDGINRAKNKIFDEVKVDESASLEHVTRSRPKGNRGRRPPTRIHMKEVANVAADGEMRLDLDAIDSTPNGTHFLSSTRSEDKDTAKPKVDLDAIAEEPKDEEPAPKKVVKPPMPPSKEKKPSENIEEKPDEVAEEKNVLKPPMPPSKENKPSEGQEDETPPKKVLTPPMPPSKEKKPNENTEKEETSEEVVVEKKVLKPPMPPSKENKPSVAPANGDATRENASDSGVESEAAPTPVETDEPIKSPPPPPSKDKKPIQASISKEKESLLEEDVDDKEDKDSDDVKDIMDNSVNSQKTVEEDEVEKVKTEETTTITLSNNVPKPQGVMWDSPSALPVEQDAQNVTKKVTPEPTKPVSELKLTPHSTPELVKKVPPRAPPKKKPVKQPTKTEDTTSSLPVAASENERVPENDTKPDTQVSQGERKVVILSLSSSGTTEDIPEDVSGPDLEEKSVDSGQLSAEESESGDQVPSSKDKLQESLQGTDGEISEDDSELFDSKVPSVDDPCPTILIVSSKPTVESSSTSPGPNSPTTQLSSRRRSASTGDLLDAQDAPKGRDVKDLRSQVSIELEETGKLLGELGSGSEGDSSSDPEILLAAAMEKLRKADEFLKEAQSFKETEKKSNRTSW